MGLALASRQRRPDDAGDLHALADIEHRIQKELERLGKMRKLAESIRDDADKLTDEVRRAGSALDLLLRKAKSTLRALDVELGEVEDAESERKASAATRTRALDTWADQLSPSPRT